MTGISLDPVILSIVKRAVPNIIAGDIFGTAPVTGPTGKIFKLKSKRPRGEPVPARLYHHFARLNNRRRTQRPEDFFAAGYPRRALSNTSMFDLEEYIGFLEVDDWCDRYLGQHSWIRFRWDNTWWFSREDHAMLFSMAWE